MDGQDGENIGSRGMTTALELGTIEKVRLREIWPDEARDFTPWLASNISLLGDALGLRLECRKREAAVGAYSLDILAHDMEGDRPVAIENQLGVTDHSHLGQLLTYAGWYDTGVMVWIAGAFRDEHREALDLLNRRTGDGTEFYGVEIEALKIDNSRLGVNFNLVAIPSKWRNPKQRSGRSGGAQLDERYSQYYQELIERLDSKAPGFVDLSREKVDAMHYCLLAPAGQNVRYSASFGSFAGYRNTSWVQLIIRSGDRDWDRKLFNQLEKHRDVIETELGESLVWRSNHFSDQSGIMVPREGSVDDDEGTHEEIREWMVDQLLKFKKVFGPRLAELVD